MVQDSLTHHHHQDVDSRRARGSSSQTRLLSQRSQVLVLSAFEHLHILCGYLYRVNMEAVRIPILPTQEGNGLRGPAAEGEDGSTTAAGWNATRQCQVHEFGRRKLRHRSKGLGRRTHIRADNNRKNIGEYEIKYYYYVVSLLCLQEIALILLWKLEHLKYLFFCI